MCVWEGATFLHALSKERRRKSFLIRYVLKRIPVLETHCLGREWGERWKAFVKSDAWPRFPVPLPRLPCPSLHERSALFLPLFCLLWLAKLSLRGKSKPFLPPAGVRLNTEMATGKRPGGKAKKKKVPASLVGRRTNWPTDCSGWLTGVGWGMLERCYQVGEGNRQLVSKTPKHAAAGFLDDASICLRVDLNQRTHLFLLLICALLSAFLMAVSLFHFMRKIQMIGLLGSVKITRPRHPLGSCWTTEGHY